MRKTKSIDEYISAFPKPVRLKLAELRQTIKKAAPTATEAISYGIPTFKLQGNLVHFAAYQKHIGFYPTSSPIRVFQTEIAKYEFSRGTIRFPIEQPLPLNLIKKIVAFRVKESLEKDGKKRMHIAGQKLTAKKTIAPGKLPESITGSAKKALTNKKIATAHDLTKYKISEVKEWHGVGPATISKMEKLLQKHGLQFKTK